MVILPLTKKFNYLLLFVALLSCGLYGQTSRKTIDKSFAAKPNVSFKQSRGPLTVLPSTDGKIRLLTEMSVDADDKEEADLFLTKLASDIKESSTQIDLEVGFAAIRSWNQTNNRTRVIFKDGTKVKNVRNFKLTTRLYLPKTELLRLRTRFEDIDLHEDLQLGDLELELHNATVRGGNVSGDLMLELRFGKLKLGNVGGRVSGNLHNVKVGLGKVGDVNLVSRFTQVEMGAAKSLDLDSHNDRYEIESIGGELDITDRFGTFIIGATEDGKVNSHNGTFEIESGGKYSFNSRFANVEFDQLQELDLRDNHNCDYEIKELHEVEGSGRFTTLEVDKLTGAAELDFHNGKLYVDELGAKFSGIEVEGSFFEVRTSPPGSAAYRVFADLDFGTVNVPEDLIVVKSHKEHSKIEMEYKSANGSDAAPAIRVKGGNGKLKIN
ncbi:MAG: hypothetical protein AAGF89_05205 [Bacteroidota bacterium]